MTYRPTVKELVEEISRPSAGHICVLVAFGLAAILILSVFNTKMKEMDDDETNK